MDLHRGIWQSIGYKQMEPILEAERDGSSPGRMKQLKEAGLEDIRVATRQYAKYQLRWIRRKSIPLVKDHGAMDYLFLLDSSNANNFSVDVLTPAADICKKFLDGQALVVPTEVSKAASEVLTAFEEDSAPSEPIFKVKACDACEVTLQSEDQWEKHIKGRKHRRTLQKRKRTALAPLDSEKPEVTFLPEPCFNGIT